MARSRTRTNAGTKAHTHELYVWDDYNPDGRVYSQHTSAGHASKAGRALEASHHCEWEVRPIEKAPAPVEEPDAALVAFAKANGVPLADVLAAAARIVHH